LVDVLPIIPILLFDIMIEICVRTVAVY